MRMTLTKCLIILSLLLGSVPVKAQTVYRLWLGNRNWSARLVGVAGTGTAGETITGTYDSKWGAFEFLIIKTGGYQLELDKAGGSTFVEDTDWDAGQTAGKFITGSDISIGVSNTFSDFARILGSADDADLWLENASGDSSNIWQEGATEYNGLPGKGLFLGHDAGSFVGIGARSGYFADSRVAIRAEQFEIRPRFDMDSVFVIVTDSTTETAQLRLTGDMIIGPDVDGDGEIWFKNSDGDLALVDMDHNARIFSIEHAKTGLEFGILSGADCRNGDWRVIGNLSSRATATGDPLFEVKVDSSASPTATIYLKGEIKVGPDADGDGEIWFKNTAGDSALVDMDQTDRYFAIQHPRAPSLGFATLSASDGSQGDWRVLGDLSGRATVKGDSLWSVIIDSTAGTANMKVNGKITAVESLCLGAFRFIVRLDTLCSITGTDTLRLHPSR